MLLKIVLFLTQGYVPISFDRWAICSSTSRTPLNRTALEGLRGGLLGPSWAVLGPSRGLLGSSGMLREGAQEGSEREPRLAS